MSGLTYEELPNTYVIFICDFDPFGEKKYRYTRKAICEEVPELDMDDGSHVIYLSTKGNNDEEVSKELVDFLKFAGAPLTESEKDYNDDFVKSLQKTINEIKMSREMGARYMTFQELLRDERAEGRAEGDRNRLVSQIQKKLAMGQSVETIADDLVEELTIVRQIVKELEQSE